MKMRHDMNGHFYAKKKNQGKIPEGSSQDF